MKLRIFAEDKPAEKVLSTNLNLLIRQFFYRQHSCQVLLLWQDYFLL